MSQIIKILPDQKNTAKVEHSYYSLFSGEWVEVKCCTAYEVM